VAALYWAAGLATGPAWNTWIGTLVPPPVRPRFFAIRTRASQAAVFVGFLLGGLLLQFTSTQGHVLTAFAALFALAGFCRLVSVSMLARQSEPVPIPAEMRTIPWRKIIHHLLAGSGGKLLLYLAAVQGAVQMAGPFFAPFMFEKLKLTYGQFVALISIAFLAKIVALPLWGKAAQGIGAQRLLWIGGVGIVPLSAGWLVSQQFSWLIVLQLVGGVAWAAYELSFFLLFFESIAEEERTSTLTIYNLINTLAWVGGSLLGGAVLLACGASYQGYLLIFGLSSVARCLALVLLGRTAAIEVESAEMGVRTVAVRPNAAALDAPVLPSLPDQTHDLNGQ
jgi:MFS family permease